MRDLFITQSTKKSVLKAAIGSLLGAAFASAHLLLFPLLALVMRSRAGYTAFTLATLYTLLFAPPPKFVDSATGTAQIAVKNIEKTKYNRYRYHGILRTLRFEGKTLAKNLPITFTSKELIQGSTLIIDKARCTTSTCTPESRIHSGGSRLPYYRYELKQKLARYVKKHYPARRSRALMTAFLTGICPDPLLHFELSQTGLTHLLAISGLHFGVIATLIGYLLSRITKHHCRHAILFALLTLYVLFLGASPSVLRAYVAISYYLVAKFLLYRPNALCALGCALIASVLQNPHMISHIGFQLSFGATAGILLYYQKIDRLLARFIPTFSPKTVSEKLAYLATRPLRSALALTLSVNLLLFPLLLYHFSTFPLLSLLYNLFFPPLFMASLLLLLFGCLLPPLHLLNRAYTEALLLLTANPLPPLALHTPPFPAALPILWIAVALYIPLEEFSWRKAA